ncbi:MAG TPA: hypothetical protein VJB99_00850 [Patescibacteria group bacterium]|nr:hypothetical protein [Patescibacteria group bacterium]
MSHRNALEAYLHDIRKNIPNKRLADRLEKELKDHWEDETYETTLQGDLPIEPRNRFGDPTLVSMLANLSLAYVPFPILLTLAILFGMTGGLLTLMFVTGAVSMTDLDALGLTKMTRILEMLLLIGFLVGLWTYIGTILSTLWLHDMDGRGRRATFLGFLVPMGLACLPSILVFTSFPTHVLSEPVGIDAGTRLIIFFISVLGTVGVPLLLTRVWTVYGPLVERETVDIAFLAKRLRPNFLQTATTTVILLAFGAGTWVAGAIKSGALAISDPNHPFLALSQSWQFARFVFLFLSGLVARLLAILGIPGPLVFPILFIAAASMFLVFPTVRLMRQRRLSTNLVLLPIFFLSVSLPILLFLPSPSLKIDWRIPVFPLSERLERKQVGPLYSSVKYFQEDEGWYGEYDASANANGFLVRQNLGGFYQIVPAEDLSKTGIMFQGNAEKSNERFFDGFLSGLTDGVQCDGKTVLRVPHPDQVIYAMDGESFAYLPCRELTWNGRLLAINDSNLGFGGLLLSQNREHGIILFNRGPYDPHELFLIRMPQENAVHTENLRKKEINIALPPKISTRPEPLNR